MQPDRYFFYRVFIASARRKKVWYHSNTQLVLDTSKLLGGVEFFLSLHKQVECVNKSTSFLGHDAVAYNFKVKEFNTSRRLGGVKNN